jgi:hypothetical protein
MVMEASIADDDPSPSSPTSVQMLALVLTHRVSHVAAAPLSDGAVANTARFVTSVP